LEKYSFVGYLRHSSSSVSKPNTDRSGNSRDSQQEEKPQAKKNHKNSQQEDKPQAKKNHKNSKTDDKKKEPNVKSTSSHILPITN
jgi:hypothetical protein